MMKYLRFLHCLIFLTLTLTSFFLGGKYLWTAFLFIIITGFILDPIFGSSYQDPEYKMPHILDFLLYLHLPLILSISFLFIWYLSPGDPFLFGKILSQKFSLNILEHKNNLNFFNTLGAFLGVGLVYGVAATNVAHELIHRIRNKKAVLTGKLLLGLTSDTSFAIEHVFGHHNKVATLDDPASARREESSYAFIKRVIIDGNKSAWKIEKERLKKKGKKVISFSNIFLRGQCITLFYLSIYFYMASFTGVLIFLITALYGKMYLELINYIEHYGLIRIPGKKVELRHSWNCNSIASCNILYNLPRHTYHHLNAAAPYWKIKALKEAPELPYGYLVMIAIALFPPYFKKLMRPLLKNWDTNFASEEEKNFLTNS